MTVAQIAYDNMKPSTKAKVDALLKKNPGPDFTDFVRSATFPDQLKRYGIKSFNGWHTISTPYSTDDSKTSKAGKENVVWAIDQCVKTIESAKAPGLEKARALRFLIHFVGDVHQPLHAVTLFSKEHPDGDDNGREYKVDVKAEKPQLHAAWDTAFGIYRDYDDSRKADLKEIRRLADAVEKTLGKPNLEETDPKAWAKESYKLAVKYAYSLPEGSKPGPGYITTAQEICQQQIGLAGLRLAKLLDEVFATPGAK